MANKDPELAVMEQVLRRLAALDEDAQRRVVDWLSDRIHGTDVREDTPASFIEAGDILAEQHVPASVREFIASCEPSNAGERLTCLTYWASRRGVFPISVAVLDELNREAGGNTYSGASSMSGSAIQHGYLTRTKPGVLELTAEGRLLVNSLYIPPL